MTLRTYYYTLIILLFSLPTLCLATSFTQYINPQRTPQLQQKRFQVEVLIYERPSQQNNALDNTIIRPDLAKSRELMAVRTNEEPQAPLTNTANYQLLAQSYLQLKQAHRILEEKAHFKILLHYAWLQDEQDKGSIHLYQATPDNKPVENISVQPDDITHQLQPYQPSKPYVIDGLIQLTKTNYYLLNVDILLRSSNQLDPAALAQFKQRRRLKPKEIHYLDTPHFGMLIAIYPLKTPPSP